jgi:hypothetical protein
MELRTWEGAHHRHHDALGTAPLRQVVMDDGHAAVGLTRCCVCEAHFLTSNPVPRQK